MARFPHSIAVPFVFLSGLCVATLATLATLDDPSCRSKSSQTLDELTLEVTSEGVSATISNQLDGEKLTWALGTSLPRELRDPEQCSSGNICWQWGNLARLSVDKSSDDQCYEVTWSVNQLSATMDCFKIGDAKWFTGAEEYFQHFPMEPEQNKRPLVPFLPGDMLQNPLKYYGGVVEPYWLSSKGIAISVPVGIPLFANWNEDDTNEFCLAAKDEQPYNVRKNVDDPLILKYSVCVGNDIKAVHEHTIQTVYVRASSIPDTRMITHPIWSTWAQYKADINESTVLQFGNEIINHGFENSQLEIDDNWESCYGDATFSTDLKFPDPSGMVSDLKAKGFRVTLWIHPFVNIECLSWTDATSRAQPYFIQDTKTRPVLNHLPGLTYWWQGDLAGYVDFTNPTAVTWWGVSTNARLEKLKTEVGIDSFKFDAGEINWFPSSYRLGFESDTSLWPGIFTTKYAESVANFGNQIEVRVGYKAQHLDIFVRMLDKDSKWGYDNGLKTMITTLLQMNLAGGICWFMIIDQLASSSDLQKKRGYSFVLPDMIGGNGYSSDPLHQSEPPTKELFVRWLQANVFMPALQFSFVPWIFDQEVSVSSVMTKRLKFMLGDELLVAPVLEEGAISRDIYLPQGTWRDEADPLHPVYEGPMWLDSYPADLWTLPYFTLVSAESK
eukprot:TCALIF_06846-PA protein Name:"Similar to Kiaa1161 Uncharacterized family 31 glucosidase KIAA1161 (Mus musculus)" AED:0.06 eAED:0.06 QI:229/0.25/0.2/1/0.5/0.4/5/0/668